MEFPYILRRHNKSYYETNIFLIKFCTSSNNSGVTLNNILLQEQQILKFGLIKTGEKAFDEEKYTYCKHLEKHKNCLFGELTDDRWKIKKNIKYKVAQKPFYLRTRLNIDRDYENN